MSKASEKYCPTCGYYKDCPYRLRNLERKCPQLSDFEYGFEQGFSEAIAKMRKEVDKIFPDNDCNDEYIVGERIGYRSVLNILDELEKEYE